MALARAPLAAGKILYRVDGVPVHAHFVMEMRTRGAARAARMPDDLSGGYGLPRSHAKARQVGIAGDDIAGMLYLDQHAVACRPLRRHNHPVAGGTHRRPA